jgi:hypothetical protein
MGCWQPRNPISGNRLHHRYLAARQAGKNPPITPISNAKRNLERARLSCGDGASRSKTPHVAILSSKPAWHTSRPSQSRISTQGLEAVTPQSARFRRVALHCGLVAAVSACSSLAPSAPELPPGSVRLSEPAVYLEWAQRTQSCSGLATDLSTVQFYVVPGVETFSTEEGQKVGLWSRSGGINRIVIAGNYANHEMVVRHEMLHALLQHEGHPTDYFVDRCHLTWDSWSSAG